MELKCFWNIRFSCKTSASSKFQWQRWSAINSGCKQHSEGLKWYFSSAGVLHKTWIPDDSTLILSVQNPHINCLDTRTWYYIQIIGGNWGSEGDVCLRSQRLNPKTPFGQCNFFWPVQMLAKGCHKCAVKHGYGTQRGRKGSAGSCARLLCHHGQQKGVS